MFPCEVYTYLIISNISHYILDLFLQLHILFIQAIKLLIKQQKLKL